VLYSHIIWDWNGTLCDDVGWCVEVINRMLSKRGLKTIKNAHEYHGLFCFPVIEYYKKAGFNLEEEPFKDLAEEFISLYHSEKNYKLRKGAQDVLLKIYTEGITQIVLSASEISNLLLQMSGFGIESYFDEILGISDIYAVSKTDLGLDFIKKNNIRRALLIGDTGHDFETAKLLDADCLLITGGHQSEETLLEFGVPVIGCLEDIFKYIKGDSNA